MISVSNPATADRPSVLVVDDEGINLELLEAVFSKSGFNVFAALNASEALDIFGTEKIDLAIVDVMMPGMDGYELCTRLKTLSGKKFFPVIILTALKDRQSKISGIESGADDFMSKPFDNKELLTRARSLIKLKELQDELEHSEDVILTLAVALEARDPYTRGHSTRVGDISKTFASFIGLGAKDQEQLRKAGILHDIGKIGLNSTLLCKEGKLTPDELEVVIKHAVIGEEICRPLVSMRSILPSIRGHHERWDGKGFPDGLHGEKIPLNARVLSVVDSFDAMTSKRPYRDGMTVAKAMTILKQEKDYGQWDPNLVDIFLKMNIPVGAGVS